jgi:hypothetical protein
MRLLFVVPLVGLALGAPAFAQTPATGDTNAALKYWIGFGLLPALDKDQEKLVQEWDKVPLDAAAVKIINQAENSLQYLHRGAALTRCDWAPNYEDGVRLLLPHLSKARTLAGLAGLRARHRFEQGNPKAGMADVVAMLRLARHVETDPIMVNHMVGYVIEGMAIHVAAAHLPAAKATLADVTAALDRLPAGQTVAQMLKKENESFLGWMIGELKAVEKARPGAWLDLWKEVTGVPAEGGEPVPDVVKAVKSFDEAVKLTEGLTPMYDELAKLTELPPKEFDAQYPGFTKKAKAANVLAGAVLPAVDKVMAAKRRAEARLALFKAAIAVVQGGPDKVKEHRDPFGDGPFEYTAVAGGFELKSKLVFKDQPVTLVVGKK